MSILIKGMKMPKDCPMCPCAHWNKIDKLTGCEIVWRHVPNSETDYWQSDKRPDWCPLVEVPPHGRLIDGDNFIKRLSLCKRWAEEDDFALGVAWYETFIRHIELTPTIIEAEEGEA